MTIRIKENSLLARIAAYKLKEKQVALVLGSTIRLYNTSRQDFLNNEKWVRHEVAHVLQYQQKGWLRFLGSYLLQTFYHGYHNNPYEIEARNKERDHTLLKGISFS
jgi:hypothetical protein